MDQSQRSTHQSTTATSSTPHADDNALLPTLSHTNATPDNTTLTSLDHYHHSPTEALPSLPLPHPNSFFFFFNDTAPPEISPLPHPDPLPICGRRHGRRAPARARLLQGRARGVRPPRRAAHPGRGDVRHGPHGHPACLRAGRRGARPDRSEEHTSELQSRLHLVCRLLLEKKKK